MPRVSELITQSYSSGSANQGMLPSPFQNEFDNRGLNIEKFGAKANNPFFNNLPAINKAIEYANSLGGGTVIIPAKTYYISPYLLTRIELKSNVSVVGLGPSSILKIMNNAGDFFTIFGQSDTSIMLKNICIKDFTIDWNIDGNQTCDIDRDEGIEHRQQGISLYNFYNVLIDNINFYETSSVNTITVNNRLCERVTISNCKFTFRRGRATTRPLYDNTAIYFQCKKYTAFGNYITSVNYAEGQGGIECHSGIGNVYGNIIDNYHVGIIIMPADLIKPQINVVNNTIRNVEMGVQLWSSPTSGVHLEGLNVCNNNIIVANPRVSGNVVFGIGTSSATPYNNIQNVVIANNNILFDISNDDTSVEITFSCGIIFYRTNPMFNITINSNVITNAPSAGIWIGSSVDNNNVVENVTVHDNIIIDAGRNNNVTSTKKNGIEIRNTLNNVSVKNNIMRDNFDTTRMVASVKINVVTTATNCVVFGNRSFAKNGSELSLLLSGSIKLCDDLILRSPNLTKYKIVVANDGTLSSSIVS